MSVWQIFLLYFLKFGYLDGSSFYQQVYLLGMDCGNSITSHIISGSTRIFRSRIECAAHCLTTTGCGTILFDSKIKYRQKGSCTLVTESSPVSPYVLESNSSVCFMKKASVVTTQSTPTETTITPTTSPTTLTKTTQSTTTPTTTSTKTTTTPTTSTTATTTLKPTTKTSTPATTKITLTTTALATTAPTTITTTLTTTPTTTTTTLTTTPTATTLATTTLATITLTTTTPTTTTSTTTTTTATTTTATTTPTSTTLTPTTPATIPATTSTTTTTPATTTLTPTTSATPTTATQATTTPTTTTPATTTLTPTTKTTTMPATTTPATTTTTTPATTTSATTTTATTTPTPTTKATTIPATTTPTTTTSTTTTPTSTKLTPTTKAITMPATTTPTSTTPTTTTLATTTLTTTTPTTTTTTTLATTTPTTTIPATTTPATTTPTTTTPTSTTPATTTPATPTTTTSIGETIIDIIENLDDMCNMNSQFGKAIVTTNGVYLYDDAASLTTGACRNMTNAELFQGFASLPDKITWKALLTHTNTYIDLFTDAGQVYRWSNKKGDLVPVSGYPKTKQAYVADAVYYTPTHIFSGAHWSVYTQITGGMTLYFFDTSTGTIYYHRNQQPHEGGFPISDTTNVDNNGKPLNLWYNLPSNSNVVGVTGQGNTNRFIVVDVNLNVYFYDIQDPDNVNTSPPVCALQGQLRL